MSEVTTNTTLETPTVSTESILDATSEMATESVASIAESTSQAVEQVAPTANDAINILASTPVDEGILMSLSGLVPFMLYLGLALSLLVAFSALYLIATPHKEITLIKNGNVAASIGFGGALIGFSYPLVKAMEQSVSIADFILWAGIGCITQLVAFVGLRVLFNNLQERIEKDQVSVGIAMASISIVVGMLNAASMSY